MGVWEQALVNTASDAVEESAAKACFFMLHRLLETWLKSTNGTGYLHSVFGLVEQSTGEVIDEWVVICFFSYEASDYFHEYGTCFVLFAVFHGVR